MKVKKTGFKIYLIAIAMFAGVTGAVLYIVQSETNNMVSELILNQAQTANRILVNSLRDLKNDAWERAEIIAGNEFVVRGVKNRDSEALARYLKNLGEGIDSANICDSDGIVLTGTHSDKIGDDISGYKAVASALLTGVTSSAVEEIPNSGLSLCASAAIYDGDTIIGAVNCNFDLSKSEFLDIFKEQNGCEATLFYGGERINTTITDEYGSRVIGTMADDIVIETVIGNKSGYTGRTELFGRTYEGSYSPVIVNGQVIGMLFTGVDIVSTLDRQSVMHYWIIFVAIIGVVAVGVLIAVSSRFTRMFANTLEELSFKEASLNILEGILKGMDAFLYVSDMETDEMIFVNDIMKKNFKLGDEATGETCWKVFRPGADKRCGFCPKYKLSANPGEPVIWEELSTITGRYYRCNDKVIDWPDGRKVHLQERYDITDIKEALKKATQASRAKSEFLSRMSHEMRTPLNAIIGMTGIAKTSKDLEKKDYCLNKVDNAAKHLLSIIGDILDMSKIESGKFDLCCDEFNFEKMLMDTVDIINFQANGKKQNIIVNLDKDVPSVIISDERRLAQVIANLLSNAVKFTPEGGRITLKVSAADKSADTYTILTEVEDNGIGISKNSQSGVFDSFEQADGGIARKYGGVGLGLAISRQIVEQMGGNIWVESEPGQGSKFSFTITVKKGTEQPRSIPFGNIITKPLSSSALIDVINEYAAPDEQTDEPSGAGGYEDNAEGSRLSSDKKSILLAEDVEINRIIVQEMLSDTGLNIECAGNGRQALNMYKAQPDKYGLILMDINMPEVDGHTATRLIRALDNTGAAVIPIIAMTANVFQEDVERCLEAGMNDHIGKPVDADELISKIDNYMS